MADLKIFPEVNNWQRETKGDGNIITAGSLGLRINSWIRAGPTGWGDGERIHKRHSAAIWDAAHGRERMWGNAWLLPAFHPPVSCQGLYWAHLGSSKRVWEMQFPVIWGKAEGQQWIDPVSSENLKKGKYQNIYIKSYHNQTAEIWRQREIFKEARYLNKQTNKQKNLIYGRTKNYICFWLLLRNHVNKKRVEWNI